MTSPYLEHEFTRLYGHAPGAGSEPDLYMPTRWPDQTINWANEQRMHERVIAWRWIFLGVAAFWGAFGYIMWSTL